jgi:hypothetical protein
MNYEFVFFIEIFEMKAYVSEAVGKHKATLVFGGCLCVFVVRFLRN